MLGALFNICGPCFVFLGFVQYFEALPNMLGLCLISWAVSSIFGPCLVFWGLVQQSGVVVCAVPAPPGASCFHPGHHPASLCYHPAQQDNSGPPPLELRVPLQPTTTPDYQTRPQNTRQGLKILDKAHKYQAKPTNTRQSSKILDKTQNIKQGQKILNKAPTY